MAAKNATIGALRVELGLGTAQFDKGLKDAGAKLGGFGKLATGAGVAVGAAMAGAAVAMGMATRQALNTADEMIKTASKVGVAVDELSRLKHAADLSGVSMDGLSTGLRKLAQNMAATADGGSNEAARAFQRLGIAVTDSSGQLRGASAVLDDVAARFGAMPDGVDKTATAIALFGRSGTDLIPMLNGGAEGLAAMKAEADALGIVIDENTARAAERFNDNLTRLGKVQEGMATQLAARLAPALADVSDTLVRMAGDARLMDNVGKVLDFTLRGLVSSAIALGAALKIAWNSIAGTAQAFWLASQGKFAEAWATFSQHAVDSGDTFRGAFDTIRGLWTGMADAAAPAAQRVVTEGFTPIARGAEDTAKAVKSAADDAAEALDTLGRDLDRVRDRALSPQERRAQQIREDVRIVQEAFARGLIDAAEMHGLIERMGSGLKLVAAPAIGDLKKDLTDLGKVTMDGPLDALRNKAEEIAEAFGQVAWAVDGIAYALKNNDWAGAVMGLIDAIKGVQAAYKQGGIGLAAGSVAGAIAPMVGGVGGAALSGMAGGAQLGMMLGGPIGAGIGAALGGIAGFLGGSSSKNAKKDAEAARKAQEAYQKRMEELARKRALELRLMELQGDAAGALAARRADELAAMDAESRALQAQIYALEDKAELESKRAAFDASFATDGERMAKVMGEVAGELARLGYSGVTTRDQFKALVLGLDHTTAAGAATYRALLDVAPKFLEVADHLDAVRAAAEAQVDSVRELAAADLERARDAAAAQVEAAREALVAAYERESSALKSVIDRFRAFSDTLRRFRDSLMAGTSAALAPQDQYRVTRSQFVSAQARAEGGDEDALAALPSYIDAFLDAAMAVAPNAVAYARDLAAGRAAAQAAAQAADGVADSASGQLAALEAQVGQLVELNAGMLSVAEAIEAMSLAEAEAASALILAEAEAAASIAAAMAAAAASISSALAQAVAVAQVPPTPAPAAPSIWTAQGYAAANPDVAAWAPGAVGTKGYDGQLITSIDEALTYHWRHHGSMEGRGFATGGSFKVGGFGGTDSQFMPLMLTPGEMVDVRRPGAMRDEAGEMAALKSDLAAGLAQVAQYTRKTLQQLEEFDVNGLHVRGAAPDDPVLTEAAA